MKADEHEIEMICRDDWEMSTALKRRRSVDESVVVEFGTVDNLGDNQFRYKYDSLSYTHLIILVHITKNAFEMCEQVYDIDYCYLFSHMYKGLL